MRYYIVSELGQPARRYSAWQHWRAAEAHARRRHGRNATAHRLTGETGGHGIWRAYVTRPDGKNEWRGDLYRVMFDAARVPHAARGDLSIYDWRAEETTEEILAHLAHVTTVRGGPV